MLRRPGRAIDSRDPLWESPRYEETLDCSFVASEQEGQWQAVVPSGTTCGRPELISEVRARPGQTVAVPSASSPDRIVVATMDYDQPLLDRLVGLFWRPVDLPLVQVDGSPTRLVPGTLGQPHLLKAPATVGGGKLPSGPLDVRSLRFLHVPGPVTVRFYEVPIQPNR